mmetsp:Transcript_121885/g.344750  ORF Transcript_121885/g.344750 Transcript_121885/m.344750 type:complete len:209 (-) Transcript_121885:1568-2194(-)
MSSFFSVRPFGISIARLDSINFNSRTGNFPSVTGSKPSGCKPLSFQSPQLSSESLPSLATSLSAVLSPDALAFASFVSEAPSLEPLGFHSFQLLHASQLPVDFHESSQESRVQSGSASGAFSFAAAPPQDSLLHSTFLSGFLSFVPPPVQSPQASSLSSESSSSAPGASASSPPLWGKLSAAMAVSPPSPSAVVAFLPSSVPGPSVLL